MASVNKVILIGNLTRAPELRYTPKGSAVAEVGLAVNRKWKDDSGATREETTFLDITFWGKTAETVAKFCTKGSPLYIEGRLHLDTWDDKTTGQKRSKVRIIAEEFQFLPTGQRPAAAAPAASAPTPSASESTEFPEDDIPF